MRRFFRLSVIGSGAAAILAVGGAWLYAQTPKPPVTTFTDTRDGQVYRTVRIGSQVWMAENLNYAADGSVCYDNKPVNCRMYGRLYTWTTAKTACPAGFHLASDGEWLELKNYVGGNDRAGTKLKSSTGWRVDTVNATPTGTNEYGFTALPGGSGIPDGGFYTAGEDGRWWSATERNTGFAWGRYMGYDYEYVSTIHSNKTNLFSVRCVEDAVKGQR